MDDYREACLKLEKARHARVYEAEKRRLFLQHAVLAAYRGEVYAALDDAAVANRAAVHRRLAAVADAARRVEDLRFGMRQCSEDADVNDRHRDRDRDREPERDRDREPERDRDRERDRAAAKRSRKRDVRERVRVRVELDDICVAADLAELRGEKRDLDRDDGDGNADATAAAKATATVATPAMASTVARAPGTAVGQGSTTTGGERRHKKRR